MQSYQQFIKDRINSTLPPQSFPQKDIGMEVAEDDGDEPLGDESSPGLDKPIGPWYKADDKIKAVKKVNGRAVKESVEPALNERHNNEEFMRTHTGEQFTPPLHELARYTNHMLEGGHGEHVAEKMVRHLKRGKGHGLKKLVHEMMKHPEVHGHMVDAMNDKDNGPKHAKRLAAAMHESYMNGMKDYGLAESVSPPMDMGAPTGTFDAPSAPMQPAMPPSVSPMTAPGGLPPSPMAMPSTEMPSEPSPTESVRKMKPMSHNHMIAEIVKYPAFADSMREALQSRKSLESN